MSMCMHAQNLNLPAHPPSASPASLFVFYHTITASISVIAGASCMSCRKEKISFHAVDDEKCNRGAEGAVRATRDRTVGGHGCMGALLRTVSTLVQSVEAHTSTFLGYETEL